MERITVNNGERINGVSLSIYDQKGKPLAALPEGATVEWTAEPAGPSTIAQHAQSAQNADDPRFIDVTTEGDDVGVVTFSGKCTLADGTVLTDADGEGVSKYEVTVVNSPADTTRVNSGTVVAE